MPAKPFCPDCGAPMLTGYPKCEDPFPVGMAGALGQFCRQCGDPLPWASREARIHELQNRLKRESLDPAKELELRELLDSLSKDRLSESEERKLWERLKASAPGLWKGSVPILQSVISETVRVKLGL